MRVCESRSVKLFLTKDRIKHPEASPGCNPTNEVEKENVLYVKTTSESVFQSFFENISNSHIFMTREMNEMLVGLEENVATK